LLLLLLLQRRQQLQQRQQKQHHRLPAMMMLRQLQLLQTALKRGSSTPQGCPSTQFTTRATQAAAVSHTMRPASAPSARIHGPATIQARTHALFRRAAEQDHSIRKPTFLSLANSAMS
jgi:hypothetical protein